MQLYYWNYRKNFGDRLNLLLWPMLLPGAFDPADDTLFAGIGSILNEGLPSGRKTIIFGSGVGYEEGPMSVPRNWDVRFLRGPISAAKLGLDRALAICDPAILIRRFYSRSAVTRPVSFMPHWTYGSESLRLLCEHCGFGYVDPAADVTDCIQKIAVTGILVTGALHGAIVADTLGVPWVPITHLRAYHDKWVDYSRSVGLSYRPKIFDALWHSEPSGAFGRVKAWAKEKIFLRQLKAAANAAVFLSRRDRIEEHCCAIEGQIHMLNQQIGKRSLNSHKKSKRLAPNPK